MSALRSLGLVILTSACVLCLRAPPCSGSAAVGGEFAALERRVAGNPDECEARQALAEAYANRGLVEEAVGQYLALLVRHPQYADAREAIEALVARKMPAWFPREVEQAPPFLIAVFELPLADPGKPGERVGYRVLVTQAGVAPPEGLGKDRLHKWAFPSIEYGYVWEPKAERWVMKGRTHWAGGEDKELARNAIKAFLALWCAAKEYLDRDPTRPWGQPIDLWISEQGDPGARAVGRDIYLYATKTPRAPAEWWRELAHEYGHVALPGIGGFTDTDDPWADGDLGELLFVKWLAAGKPADWLPWSLPEAETIAAARRQALIAGAAGAVDAARLNGTDARARDYFLGLALAAEEEHGPGILGAALAKCPRGRPAQFVAALRKCVQESRPDGRGGR